jgi:uncharacterized protein HemY
MLQEAEALIGSGKEALKAGDWLAARAAFEAAFEQKKSPEAMFGAGDAVRWLCEIELAIRYRERAYAAFRRRPNPAPRRS